jgi:hypothetical protein
MGRQIGLLPEVADYLEKLVLTLYEQNYFGSKNASKEYVGKIVDYAFNYLGFLPDKKAPVQFDQYGKNMKYLSYRANKHTTWYIFFQKHDEYYLVRHITNNYVAAKYMLDS